MNLVYLNSQESSANMITEFGGYNHNPVINEAEFYDMKNLTSDKYPLASNRDKRGLPEIELPSGAEIIDICGKEAVYVIYKSGTDLCICEYNPTTETVSNSTTICTYVSGMHQVIEMGAYLEIFPEKYQVNTLKKANDSFTEIEPLEKSENSIDVWPIMTTLDGTKLKVRKVSATAPVVKTATTTTTTGNTSFTSTTVSTFDGASWDENDVWIDKSGDMPVCKRYSKEQNSWATVTTYLTLYKNGKWAFEKDDAIQIEWPSSISSIVKPADKQKYFVISKVADTYERHNIPIGGVSTITVDYYWIRFPIAFNNKLSDINLDILGVDSGAVHNFTAKRTLPDMDYIIECQNRLWGCRYGTDSDGETINEIFASKLADAKNWHYFSNTSVDSYYVSLGSDGEFTGAVTYQSTPIFFKRNCIHRISGNYPAQYNMNTLEAYGVKDGCSKSVIVMNDIVYYMSPVGALCYAGSLPKSISEPFGAEKYSNAISGTVGNRLYMSMQDESNTWHLFAFDDSRLTWHREDNTHAKAFCTFGHECLAVDNDNKLISLTGVYGDKEDAFEWSMTSGEIGYGTPMRKRLLKLVMRLKLDINSRAKIEIQYDGDGTWHYVNDLRPTGKTGGYSVPICPTRCDHFSIRISGKGNINLLSVTKFYTEGSDKD